MFDRDDNVLIADELKLMKIYDIDKKRSLTLLED